jgi:hypothetical protein
MTHGFVRSPSGQITEFNGTGNQSITVTGITSSGQIIGNTQGVFLPPFTYAATQRTLPFGSLTWRYVEHSMRQPIMAYSQRVFEGKAT